MRTMRGAALAALLALAAGTAQAESTVRFWYHFDNPDNPVADLVAKFEAANPGIKVEAENIPWNSYYDNLYTAIAGGNAPDAAMVKLFAQPRLVEMGALEPIDDRVAGWDGKADLQDDLLKINGGPDGKQYYLPVQYVVSYLYYRADLFAEAGLQPPKTCDDFAKAAKALTRDTNGDGQPDIWGFGFRGGKGGYDHWGPFVLSAGAKFEKGGLTSQPVVAANTWLVDLFRNQKLFPPSAPNDGFQEIIAAFQQGRTAMTIHHIGSSAGMVKALGDKVSAVPVPRGSDGKGWTLYGDESNAVFAGAKDKAAAFKWISFLSTGQNNADFVKLTGQLSVTTSGAKLDTQHEARFVAASTASLPIAGVLPDSSKTADFTSTVWPTNMQQALLGQITPEQMMRAIDKLYNG